MALAAVVGLLLVLGILSEPLFALVAGVLIGPAAFGLFDLAHFGDPQNILGYALLLTPAVALVGVALRLPEWYSLRNGRLLIVLLGCLMCCCARCSDRCGERGTSSFWVGSGR